jgi:hypothetical protein
MFGHRTIEIPQQIPQLQPKLRASHRPAVSSRRNSRIKVRQFLDGTFGFRPIWSEVSRGSVNLLLLREHRPKRFLFNSDEGIARDGQAVLLTEQRDVPDGVSGRVEIAPPPT